MYENLITFSAILKKNCRLCFIFLFKYDLHVVYPLPVTIPYERDFPGLPFHNICKFDDFVDRIYPIEFEIKITYTATFAAYLDLHLDINSECRLRTISYCKRDDFNFPIVNFPFICSNISAIPAYGVYISQLIRY